MDRREVLSGSAILVAATLANAVRAAEPEAAHAHHHEHGQGSGKLATAAADCVQTGQVCIDHCLVLIGQGDKSLAECVKTVNQMMATCTALQRLANAKSKYLPQIARLALDVCRDCEDECKKHAEKHKECKACMEACVACAKECKAVSA